MAKVHEHCLLWIVILSPVYPRPHYALLSLLLCGRISYPFIWAVAFLYLLFTHVYDFAGPRRCLNLLAYFNWKIKWTYICYHYWYILIPICLSLWCSLFVPQDQFFLSFLVFFWVDWVCCLAPLFSSCITLKIILFFISLKNWSCLTISFLYFKNFSG